MSDPNHPETPETQETPEAPESTESFDQLLSEYEREHARVSEDGARQLEGTVVAVTADAVLLDIGFKSEGILPLADFQAKGESVKPGDRLAVSVKGRDLDGYYELSRTRISRPKDWTALEKAFTEKATIVGTVTGVVKGGVSVDVGVRAFMPASRSATRDAAALEKLVGQEIRCRITKLDVTEEDVVVDRRALAEEEERAGKERRYAEVKEGDIVHGTVRSLTDYGAFVDLGGADGLLHISDIAWTRVNKPEDVLTVGQEIEARVLKVDTAKQRISLGMKQLLTHPWDAVPGKYRVGDRVRGAVTRIVDFGAFVELEPGVEGLVHVSEMSWAKKVRTPGDLVKSGDIVEVVILGIKLEERRMSLGLKQALGDPWADAAQRFAVASVIEGTVISLPKFGAFVQLSEGVEGLIHVSEISADKRINHPQEVLKVGQAVKAQVMALDTEKRLIRLSIKQLVPTGLDEYLSEHKTGDRVTGRLTEIVGGTAKVELGEGVFATCDIVPEDAPKSEAANSSSGNVSALGSMLMARWKGGESGGSPKPEPVREGQIRTFRIAKLDPETKKIKLVLA